VSDNSLTIAEVVDVFRHHLYLQDDTPVLGTLGAAAANLLDKEDPVWWLLVGATSGGKTEIISALTGLPNVNLASTLTEASLLSGTSKKERAANAKGGLLREIGDFGILVCKDFTSILSMSGDARSSALAALREVYDGSWTRHVGTDGGQKLHWAGKVGFVGGVTPTIDRHHTVMAVMGQRFLLHRLPVADKQDNKQTKIALGRKGKAQSMREELSLAVRRLFLGIGDRQPTELDEAEQDRLGGLADFVVVCRSAVERGGRNFDIELIPEPEGAARLALQLRALAYGLDVLGVDRQRAWQVITKTALDCVPAIRLRVLQGLWNSDGDIETPTLAARLGYPTPTARRALEDLGAHELVERTSRGTGRSSDTWVLGDWAAGMLCKPEIADALRGHRVCKPETADAPLEPLRSKGVCKPETADARTEPGPFVNQKLQMPELGKTPGGRPLSYASAETGLQTPLRSKGSSGSVQKSVPAKRDRSEPEIGASKNHLADDATVSLTPAGWDAFATTGEPELVPAKSRPQPGTEVKETVSDEAGVRNVSDPFAPISRPPA
jgi:hypothetical protein